MIPGASPLASALTSTGISLLIKLCVSTHPQLKRGISKSEDLEVSRTKLPSSSQLLRLKQTTLMEDFLLLRGSQQTFWQFFPQMSLTQTFLWDDPLQFLMVVLLRAIGRSQVCSPQAVWDQGCHFSFLAFFLIYKSKEHIYLIRWLCIYLFSFLNLKSTHARCSVAHL